MNVILLVVDSLRACSLGLPEGEGPQTPFLQRLGAETTNVRGAYATECWTLPAHCSMFTGLLPSQHGAHFQTMAYSGTAPTVAEPLTRYKQNLAAAVVGTRRVIVRREGLDHYDLDVDPLEAAPAGGTITDFEAACRRDGLPAAPIAAAAAHLRRERAASDRAQTRALGRTSPDVRSADQPPLAGSLAARGPC